MKTNLIEPVKFCFTDDVIDHLAQALGQASAATKQGLAQAVPLVLSSVLRQAEQDGTASALLLLARKTDELSGPTPPASLAEAPWYQQGGAILVELLGSTYGPTVGYLAQDAGLPPEAAERLLQLAATAVLGTLGKLATATGVLPSEFVRWLTLQKASIGAALLPGLPPAEGPAAGPPASQPRRAAAVPLRPASALTTGGRGASPAGVASAPVAPPAARYWPGSVLQWGILLLLAMSLGYFFGRDRLAGMPAAAAAPASPAPGPAAVAPPTGRYDQNRDTYIYDTGQPIILTLADGSVQKVGANSTENRLYNFLATPAMQVDSVNRTKGWINFDRVYFEPSKATLTPESAQQLHNVASILKSFPKAVVKIGGYTDSSGVAVHNFQLSEERAKAAMFTLIALGIPADNLQFKGYGPKHFLIANTTPAGRALNRRISVRVIQK